MKKYKIHRVKQGYTKALCGVDMKNSKPTKRKCYCPECNKIDALMKEGYVTIPLNGSFDILAA